MKTEKKSVGKKLLIVLAITVSIALLSVAGIIGYAYFSTVPRVYTEEGTQIARLGMNLSLLFDKIDSDAVAVDTDLGILQSKTTDAQGNEVITNYRYDGTKDWGTPQNPYLISELRHLQNLSVLQDIGYFDQLYISQNYENGSYKGDGTVADPGNPIMPYFLVCAPDGSATTIDGEGIVIRPIGNDAYPFIGYVGGAFQAETTTEVGDFTSDTSAIYNVLIRSDEDETDVGIFGSISYLGTEPEYNVDADGNITYEASFYGAVSTVRDLLLADVQIEVKQDSFIENLAEHFFTYSKLSEEDQKRVAHEDHHIGILSGHVEYATIELISVHYGSEEKTAIDLLHTDANYYSSTGIMGFVYNMNPIINEDGTVGTGSGTSGADILLAVNGAGTGGGLASGTGRGYVTASEMFKNYSYTQENRNQGQIVWHYTYFDGEHQNSNHGILIYEKKDGSGNTYYTLDDDQTLVQVSEINGTMTATLENNSWTNFLFRTGEGTEESPYEYYTYKPGTTTPVQPEDFHQQNLMIIDGADKDGNPLCTEWIRNRILGGTENTGRYYFYDGVFTFCLSSQTDVFRDTWKNNQAPEIVLGENDDSAWKANTSRGNKAVVTYVKPIRGIAELDEAIAAGKKIFISNQAGAATAGMSLTMMSLANGSTDSGLADNAYRMTSTTQSIADEERKLSILETLEHSEENELEDLDGNQNQTLCEAIRNNEIYIIDLGSAEYLNALRNEYQITATKNGNTYRFCGHNLNDETDKYLSLLYRNPKVIGISLGHYYNIFCGTQTEAAGKRGYVSNVTDSTLIYSNDNSNPYFRISFTNGESRYVQYNGDGYFNGSETETDNGRMYFYTVEGMHNIDHGYITFDPAEDTQSTSFIADEAILWPNETFAGGVADTSTSYTLKTLESLGWKNAQGETILSSPSDLHKKFHMTETPGFGLMLNLLGGSLDLGNSKQVVAPVGTNGVQANIPMGCVAFRINTNQESTVRVIVAVPVSEYYDGEGQNDEFFDETYRFGLWQVEEAGGSMVQSFNVEDAIEQFELPRSNPYQPGTEAGDTSANSIEVIHNDTTYRCYLNGLRVLVGYEFTVSGEGVYIIGTTSGPMEIVHFSADGTASAGRDGTSGSKLGSIDFVYDYDGKIVTVKESSDSATEDYSQYYASMCLLYTDITKLKDSTGDVWQFYKINDQQITIRREIGVVDPESSQEGSLLNLTVASGDATQPPYIKCVGYSVLADVIKREDGTRQ